MEDSILQDQHKQLMEKERAVNFFRKIQKMTPKAGQDYCVIVYFLAKEPKDGCVGMWFFVGTYSSYEKAEKKAKEISLETGVPNVYFAHTCSWQQIDDKPDIHRTIMVLDSNEQLDKAHEEACKKKEEELLGNTKRFNEIDRDFNLSVNKDNIEHYADEWLSVMMIRSAMQRKTTEIENLRKRLEEKKENLLKHRAVHPDHDDDDVLNIMKRMVSRHGPHISLNEEDYLAAKESILHEK